VKLQDNTHKCVFLCSAEMRLVMKTGQDIFLNQHKNIYITIQKFGSVCQVLQNNELK